MDSFGIHLSASWAAFLLMIMNLNDFPNIVIFSTGNSPLHLAVMLGHKGEQHVQYHMTTNQEHNHPCQISQLARLWFMYLVNFQLYCQPQTNVLIYLQYFGSHFNIRTPTMVAQPLCSLCEGQAGFWLSVSSFSPWHHTRLSAQEMTQNEPRIFNSPIRTSR